MPFCRECGAEVTEGAKFCHNCGQELKMPEAPKAETEQSAAVQDGPEASSAAVRATYPPVPPAAKVEKPAVLGWRTGTAQADEYIAEQMESQASGQVCQPAQAPQQERRFTEEEKAAAAKAHDEALAAASAAVAAAARDASAGKDANASAPAEKIRARVEESYEEGQRKAREATVAAAAAAAGAAAAAAGAVKGAAGAVADAASAGAPPTRQAGSAAGAGAGTNAGAGAGSRTGSGAGMPADPPAQTDGLIMRAWKDVRNSKGWVGKCLLLALITAVPILNFVACGYILRWGRMAAYRDGDELPSISITGDYFKLGFFSILICFCWSVVLSMLATIPVIGILVVVVAVFAVPVICLCTFRTNLLNRLGAAFELKTVWRMYRRDIGGTMAIAWLPGLISVAVCVAVGLIATFGLGISALGASTHSAVITGVSVLFAVFFMVAAVFVVCIVGVAVSLVSYRAYGYWVREKAPEWTDEARAAAYGTGA